MADSAFWIASLTAGTAVLASWVTSRGTARAARIQADTTTNAQRVERLRETRRTAYADFVEQAQRLSGVHWKVSDVYRDADGVLGPEHIAELRRLRDQEVEEYTALRNRTWIVSLEGPEEIAELANRVRRSTSPFYKALGAMIDGDPGAAERFDACYSPFWQAHKEFVKAARDTLNAM